MFAPQKPKIGFQIFTAVALFLLGSALAYFWAVNRKDDVGLKALNLGSDQVVYFPFISKFETGMDTSKLLFGPGFIESLSRDLSSQAFKFQKCRQFYLASSPLSQFRVTVLADVQKLQVKSLMASADSNGPHAACLRDTLEDLVLPALAKAPKIQEERYKLVIDLQSRVSASVPFETK